MNPGNLDTNSADKTANYFNNVYNSHEGISPAISSSVISWFQEQTGSRETATLLARTLFSTAESLGEDPRVILSNFQKLGPGELTSVLALYLNTGRIPTSLLGVNSSSPQASLITRTLVF
jgi:hypothetical protein